MIARVTDRGDLVVIVEDATGTEREVLQLSERPAMTDDADTALEALGFERTGAWIAGEFTGHEAKVAVPMRFDGLPTCRRHVYPHVAACYCERPEHEDNFHACACGGAWLGDRHPDIEVLVTAVRARSDR